MRLMKRQILAALVLSLLLGTLSGRDSVAAGLPASGAGDVSRPLARPDSGEPDGHSTMPAESPPSPRQGREHVTLPELTGAESWEEAMRIMREWLIQLLGVRAR